MKLFCKAIGVSAGLSALFLALYGGCNWITARRTHIGSYFFPCERHVPFVPAMIVPYMSIDLFFVAAPIFARSDRKLKTLALRIIFAILFAATCFLMFPLKFAFDRPQVGGALGLIFNNFRQIDLPFNQFPSLHIALLVILLDFYVRRLRGSLRWGLVAWFALIAMSTMLTYQHHVIDIIGGVVLGALCLHLIDDQPLRAPFNPNRRVAIYYGAGSLLLAGLALAWMPYSRVLFWPAFSLAFVAAGYLALGPGIYRKRGGRHSVTAWLLLGPALFGQRISLAYYARRCRPYDALTDRLWIGRRLSSAEARQARAAGVTAVVDLAGELSEHRLFRKLPYLQIATLDLTAPTPHQIDQALAFITEHADSGIVYLHCKAGFSRTAVVAGAYLFSAGLAETLEECLLKLRQSRAALIVRGEALAALEAMEARMHLATSGTQKR